MKKYLNNLTEKIAYFFEELFAFISEPQCPGCGNFLENPHISLCGNCRKEFKFLGDGPVCLICNSADNVSCECQSSKQFDIPRLYYWATYTDVVQELIHQFKFEGHHRLGKYLADKAIDALYDKMQLIKVDYVIPVPMLERDKRRRGYNQTELIAKAVSLRMNVPAHFDLLKKIKRTKLQANLGAKERWENIEDAFAVTDNNDMKGHSILLVDDIVTTGATCYYSAKALYLAGAEHITVFALVSSAQEAFNFSPREKVSQWEVSE
jgi:competence protein ComFC